MAGKRVELKLILPILEGAMFGFIQRKNCDEVKRVMNERINRHYAKQIRVGNRGTDRVAFCEIVWVIPFNNATGQREFENAFPTVTRDISPGGLSLIHTMPIHCDRLLVGLQGDVERIFLDCICRHSAAMGYGFFQLGLEPGERVLPSPIEMQLLGTVIDRYKKRGEPLVL